MQCDSVTKNLKVTSELLAFAEGILSTSAPFFIQDQESLKCANH